VPAKPGLPGKMTVKTGRENGRRNSDVLRVLTLLEVLNEPELRKNAPAIL